MGILLGILTVVLIFVSLFLMLVILAQKSKDGGMGTALGGGAAEAAFGAETNTVLSKATIYSSVLFFVLAFLLYLGRIYERTHARAEAGSALPTITAPAAPAAPTTAAPTVATPAPAGTKPAASASTAPITVPAAPTPAATTTTPSPAPATPAPKK